MKQPAWRQAKSVFSGGTAEATALIGRPVRARKTLIHSTHLGEGKEGSPVTIAAGSTGFVTGAHRMSIIVTFIDPPMQPLPAYDRNKLLAMTGRKVTSIVLDWDPFRTDLDIG